MLRNGIIHHLHRQIPHALTLAYLTISKRKVSYRIAYNNYQNIIYRTRAAELVHIITEAEMSRGCHTLAV